MILSGKYNPEHLDVIFRFLTLKDKISPSQIAEKEEVVGHFHKYCQAILKGDGYQNSLDAFNTFLPPRLVIASKKGNLVPFFGAGTSASVGIPTWEPLLDKLGIPQGFKKDPYLKNDALTTAELIAHKIGSDRMQKELRSSMKGDRSPALAHYLMAFLSQPIYITSNYDELFETAYERIHGGKPVIITNDADLYEHGIEPDKITSYDGDKAILLKIHGCVARESEQLILTRSQYRSHYRINEKLFGAVRKVLESKHTLFLGLGHKDPEITRLVEDVIHYFDRNRSQSIMHPAIYSLQFDMEEKSPEVFAARGIVALHPHLSIDAPKELDYKTTGLNKALLDLLGAMDSDVHKKEMHLNDILSPILSNLEKELEDAKNKLELIAKEISKIGVGCQDDIKPLLSKLRSQLGELAGQGVYLLDDKGDIICVELNPELKNKERQQKKKLNKRFYVQQAKTFRKFFVSDSDLSKFNGQSTFFLCQPIGNDDKYEGLLFSAVQIGAWETPIRLKEQFLAKHPSASFILIDSNGVALMPPNQELKVCGPMEPNKDESAKDNRGFDYARLHRLSRRDQLISRIWENIVPLSEDDDVQIFSDIKIYSVVSNVQGTKWKLALSLPIPMKKTDE